MPEISLYQDTKLTQWLHTTLVDQLSRPLLVAYFEALQTIRAKVPSLVDRMTASGPNSSKTAPTVTESLAGLMKRPWDPVLGCFSQQKLVSFLFWGRSLLDMTEPRHEISNNVLPAKAQTSLRIRAGWSEPC